MEQGNYSFGMIGLGTMGRSLLLNIADHDFSGAGYDKDLEKGRLLEEEGNGKKVKAFASLREFVQSLQKPRSIMMLVPAGRIVDSVIEELIPLLEKDDIIIDGGNSHFKDTTTRVAYLEGKGLNFFGMGVSGGEEGARKGPSMMPGGNKEAYRHVKHIFEAIAAKVNGEACVTYIGPGASGHFVKMVHNGIEYGLMQLIAETYEVMKKGLSLDDAAIADIFKTWNEGRLQSFLMDITKDIFVYKDKGVDHLLLHDIKDEARAKGTGKWTSQEAMDLELPVTIIDTAVSMRDLSKYKTLRTEISAKFGNDSVAPISGSTTELVAALEQAFYFAMVMSYAQGMHMLAKASKDYQYQLDLAGIARIWRGGCIIRSTFLEDIYQAYTKDTQLAHLLLDEQVGTLVNESVPGARNIISAATVSGIAVPAYSAALSYFDTIRSARMPANLIQAQRDYFGAHTYQLIGKEGVFHTEWNKWEVSPPVPGGI
ncbi:MAG: NADP-dependent phosphogluconate dehydrogenase [Bacteroidota bacterium]